MAWANRALPHTPAMVSQGQNNRRLHTDVHGSSDALASADRQNKTTVTRHKPRHQEALLLSEQIGHALLQPGHRGILTEHVIPHLGPGHGRSKPLAGPRHGVAPKIYNWRGGRGGFGVFFRWFVARHGRGRETSTAAIPRGKSLAAVADGAADAAAAPDARAAEVASTAPFGREDGGHPLPTRGVCSTRSQHSLYEGEHYTRFRYDAAKPNLCAPHAG